VILLTAFGTVEEAVRATKDGATISSPSPSSAPSWLELYSDRIMRGYGS
jgi:hypothetical protein